MLSRELAVALRDAGLTWAPQNGDRFVVPDRDLDEMVFVLSDMVVEEVRMPDGTHVLAFNGTTEWALDALEASEAIWVPSEVQLRERFDDEFESLERLARASGEYAVTAWGARHVDGWAANAYARALLHRLQ